MITDQLKTILEKHRKWLLGEGGARAVLTGVNLTRVNLTDTNLTRVNLTGADLTRANLTDANLTGANLTGVSLARANLTGANLTGAVLTDAVGATAPIIPNIDAKILAAIATPGNQLDMAFWHACETTHCRAGWAVNLAGLPGKMLEERIGAAAAGALIYAASRPGKPVPNFYATNEDAMADLRACASESAQGD